jgi:ribulose-phosphate 3-epimerase
VSQKPLDVHLMIEKPERYIADFKQAGADCLSVHWEACTHLHRTIHQIKDLDMLAGVALNPHTPIALLEDMINDVDFVVLMSVNPGFGGQRFIKNSIPRVIELRKLIEKHKSDAMIEIDGGVDLENAPILVDAGVDILVAGNTIFGSENPIETIKQLKIVIND